MPAFRNLVWLATLVLAGCGGGGGGTDLVAQGWVTVDAANAPNTVCNDTTLTGKAFISPTWWGCCTGTAEKMTGVTVTWRNETGGQSGAAYQHVNLVGSFGISTLADHSWSATVPLVMGANTIAIQAQDPSGLTATKRVTIVKSGPSYSVSGRLSNQVDFGLGYLEAGMSVTLSGNTTRTNVVNSAASAGVFRMSCVPPGTYRLTPSPNPFNYPFVPAYIDLQVVNADISNLDMVATTYNASGNITYSTNGTPVTSIPISISSAGSSLYTTSDSNGNFRFTVPNGNYRIQPFELYFQPGTFNPTYQDITVSGNNMSNVNFTK